MKKQFYLPVKACLLIVVSLLSFSCTKKDNAAKPVDNELVQHFNATISGKQVSVQNTVSKNRELLTGQWTGVGNTNAQKEIYTINVALPENLVGQSNQPALKLQIEDIKEGSFQITGANSFIEPFKSYIFLVAKKSTNNSDGIYYTANPAKKPFNVQITGYDFIKGSLIPTVTGKLNGTLYNVQNIQDSVVIQNGDFKVRY